MGKHKLRLSEMIPNAWFYKLKDMSRLRNDKQQQKKGTNPTIKKLGNKTSSSSSISLSSSSSVAVAAAGPPNAEAVQSSQRKSYYFSRDLIAKTKSSVSDKTTEVPRKSSRRRRSTKTSPRRRRLVNSSSTISAGCSCRTTIESVWNNKADHDHINHSSSSDDHDSMLTEFGSETPPAADTCKCCRGHKNKTKEIAATINNNYMDGGGDDDKVVNLMINGTDGELFNHHPYDLPPIITKKLVDHHHHHQRSSLRNAYGSVLSVTVVQEDILRSTQLQTTNIRRDQHDKTTTTTTTAKKNINKQQRLGSSSPAGGLKLRTNSPRIANRRRKTAAVSETFAVVKTSRDPQRDFRDSMMEMILENNITASQDLEDLLACYLSLNSHQYHHLIINVFKQIWFHYLHVPLSNY